MTNSMPGCKSDTRPQCLTIEEWEERLSHCSRALPELVAQRELRLRKESKFVMPAMAAAEIVSGLSRDYAILTAGTALVATYRTLYFDSDDLAFFHAHRRGRRVRHKVRIRHYPERGKSYLDVKTRVNELKTIKTRRARPYGDSDLSLVDAEFARTGTGSLEILFPGVWTNFRRVTLVGIHTNERVTVDLELSVTMGDSLRSFANVAIMEVKQAPFCRRTPAMMALRGAGWRPQSMSKYCAAVSCLWPEVRSGLLRSRLRTLEGASA